MLIARHVAWMFSAGLMALATGAANSQDYPNKLVRIVTSGVGGSNDFAARLIAPGLTTSLGQPVIVDNRGGGVIPGQIVSNSPPDGYTLLLYGAPIWIGPLLQKTPYDIKDFAPISLTNRAPNVLVVHPALPVKSVKDLIALAKAKPGALNFSTGGTGASGHLAAELFNAMTGVKMVRVAYKSDTQERPDLLSGQVQLSFPNAANVTNHIKSGRLRGVAVTSAQPSPLVPGLPTIAASGVPGYQSVALSAVFAPAGTPAPIINRLNQEIVRILQRPDVKEKYLNNGIEAASSSPQELAATLASEIAKWGKVIKDAGITGD